MNHGSENEEDPQFTELAEEFDRLNRKESFGRGRLIRQMHDEEIFGPWGSFENAVTGRFRIGVRYAYFLKDGVYNCDLLESHGCQLPNSEHQIRALSYLKDDNLKVLAWTRACQQKRQGSPPSNRDVPRKLGG